MSVGAPNCFAYLTGIIMPTCQQLRSQQALDLYKCSKHKIEKTLEGT